MSHPTSTPTAPVLACAEVLVGALDGVVDADPMWLTLADKESVLVSLQRSADRVNELLARVLAVAGDVAEEHGQRDAASWLAHQTRHDPARLRRLEKLGKALREDAPVLAGGVRAGVASVEQAQVITHALVDLPADLRPDIKAAAETVLTAECVNLAPRSLAIAGRRVLEVIDPDAADEHERRRLEAQERGETCPGFVYRRRNGDGTSDFRIRIGDAAADRLMTYLEAYANPRASRLLAGARSASATGGSPPVPEARGAPAPSREGPAEDRRPYPQRLAAALEAFLEHADPNRMPLHGGSATQIIVTIALADLISGLGHGLIDGDQPYPVGEIRRLACTAGIVPAVLGTNSEVLDLGRTARLFNTPQRKALRVNQSTCRAEGCDIPSAWCEAHHAGTPWAQGGNTDLADGVLLCNFHHHRAHDHSYTLTRTPDARLRFTRRH